MTDERTDVNEDGDPDGDEQGLDKEEVEKFFDADPEVEPVIERNFAEVAG